MTGASPLIVPMTVEALVVNAHVRHLAVGQRTFMRSDMQYGNLSNYVSSQPSLGSEDTKFVGDSPADSAYYNGVYVKWRLPKAFTRGVHDPAGGLTTFPPVPNRWIVVRTGGDPSARTVAAWMVESDYVSPPSPPTPTNASQIGSYYVQPQDGTPTPVYIGRNVALGAWAEQNGWLGLTAVGPGNPAFAFYQQQNNNVFSLIDSMNTATAQTFSYEVFGWISKPDQDPLADVAKDGLAKVLERLGWTLPAGTDASLTASWSLLSGSLSGVRWQTDSLPPSAAPQTDKPLAIAAGNTGVEALTALVSAQAALAGVEVDAELLEAFQLDMLDVLDEPDGAALLAEKLHASFFQRYSGGYTWHIDAVPGAEPVPAEELAEESAWLAALNTAQAQLDADIRALEALQLRLYEMWWKWASWGTALNGEVGVLGPTGKPMTSKDLLDELQPSVAGTLAEQVATLRLKIMADRDAVPSGDDSDALKRSIADYAAKHGLPATRVLKRGAAPPFYEPNNPVVLIAGAGATGIVPDPTQTVCRFPSQLVTGITLGGNAVTAATPGLKLPQPDLSGVSGVPWQPELAAALVVESFFTDPCNATMIQAAVPDSTVAQVEAAMQQDTIGTRPDGALTSWTENPWHPLLLFWEVDYYPIAYGTDAARNWVFQDGRYVWGPGRAGADTTEMIGLGGMIQLTPAAAFNVAARIRSFLASAPSLNPRVLGELTDLLKRIEGSGNEWDLLSQALSGFNQQLTLRMPGVFTGPDGQEAPIEPATPTLATLIGGAAGYPPAVGSIPIMKPPPGTGFQSWRAGQLTFTQLMVVDEWGQAVSPIDASTSHDEEVCLPAEMAAALESNAVPFTITTASETAARAPIAAVAGPVIASLDPDLVQAGMATSAEVPLTVEGTGFGAGDTVKWQGEPLRTEFVDSTKLVAAVPASLLALPGTAAVTVQSDGVTSAAAVVTISANAAIGSVVPSSAVVNSPELTITVNGVGFEPGATVAWNGTPIDTTFVGPERLTARVPAANLTVAGTAEVSEIFGQSILAPEPDVLAQVPPAVAQPARLDFALLSATDDGVVVGPSAPSADPVCGWILPNHLDGSIMAYDSAGAALGEMAIGVTTASDSLPCWAPAPGSPYARPDRQQSLDALAAGIEHFGPFLRALAGQDAPTFSAFLEAIDETLWTTVPMGAVFDKSLAVLVGRPLAMVRSRVRFELAGPAYPDPSWQYTFAEQPPGLEQYRFAIELGNVARLDDGLIGYFEEDAYGAFNIVQQSGAVGSSYLRPIGANDNYVYLPFDGTSQTHLSMLVDPRGPVHATTAILPTGSAALEQRFVDDALSAMDVTFRLNGVLTDQRVTAKGVTTVLLPVPDEKVGAWSWLEQDDSGWTGYGTAPNDPTARLTGVPPVLRRGMLRLSTAFKPKGGSSR